MLHYSDVNVFYCCLGGKVQQMLTGIQSSDEGLQLQSVIEMCQVKQGLHCNNYSDRALKLSHRK